MKIANGIDTSADLRKQISGVYQAQNAAMPKRQAEAMLKIVDADDPPLRVAVGAGILPMSRAAYADRLVTWKAGEAVSKAAQGEPAKDTISSY